MEENNPSQATTLLEMLSRSASDIVESSSPLLRIILSCQEINEERGKETVEYLPSFSKQQQPANKTNQDQNKKKEKKKIGGTECKRERD